MKDPHFEMNAKQKFNISVIICPIMEAVTRSVISVPGVTYYNDLDFGTWSLDLLFSALADDAAKGTQRLAISGRAGPMVKAHLAEPGPLPPAVLHLWNCAVHQKKSVTQADTPFQASVNLYKPESLMVPHKDGRGTKALVFSLGAACSVLKFFFRPNESSRTYTRVFEAPSADELVVSYLLEPGSLLVMEGEAFTDW